MNSISIMGRQGSSFKLSLWLSVLAVLALCAYAPAQTISGNVVHVQRVGTFGSGVGQFQYPFNVAVDHDGNVYVADSGNNRIVKINAAGKWVSSFGTLGTGPGQFNIPADVAVDPSGNIYVADSRNQRVQKFDGSGKFVWEAVLGGRGQQYTPHGIALDDSGKFLYVADTTAHAIVKLNSDGQLVMRWGQRGAAPGEFQFPHDIALDKAGNVYVADFGNNRIQKFTADGKFLTAWGKLGPKNGEFNYPWGVAVDPQNRVWVADMANHRLQVFSDTGALMLAYGSYSAEPTGPAEFNHPKGIAISANGDVWVAHPGVHGVDRFRLETNEGQHASASAGQGSPAGRF
jgi:DNA-binding beta-propeller fold protein YncE